MSARYAAVILVLSMATIGHLVDGARQARATAQPDLAAIDRPPPIPTPDGLAAPRSFKQVGLPDELTQAAIPRDDPLTPQRISLGEKLFFDGRLSADSSVACATCHNPTLAFTDGRPVSIGVHGRAGQRNAPTILNVLYNKAQFWEGRAKTLEEQAGLPIVNPSEMGQPNLDAAVGQIADIEEYRQAFVSAFGRPVNGPDLLRAIAAYERSLGRSIPRSIASSPVTRMRSTTRLNAAGSCSTPRHAATSAMR